MVINDKFALSLFTICALLLAHLDCQKTSFSKIDSQPLHTGYVEIRGVDGYSHSIPFYFSVPPSYQISKTCPLLIVLHDSCENAISIHANWRSVADSTHCVLLTLQGDVALNNGYDWGRNAENALMDCLASFRSLVAIDSKRIYLIGIGSGGWATFQIGLKYATHFAGLAIINGTYDFTIHTRLTDNTSHPEIFISHTNDNDDLFNNAVHAVHLLEQNDYHVKFIQPLPNESIQNILMQFFKLI
jgi:predicted peptidase